MTRKTKKPSAKVVRCAIYTRKSTEEGLDQEFNTLDAQRESAEAYIASQQHEGWTCLPDFYDDGGFTGGNMDRPALRRLMADIEAGRVDCIVVYKVDRLSRSLLDFARMMETFERHHVTFVSVTQQFSTTNSMGRLTLNVLLSFAQFEREMISERTRDKIAATRRKGKWSGGMPVLGYDVKNVKLIVNELEAGRVLQIFELYLEQLSLIATAKELNLRGWKTKCWTTHKGIRRGGRQFTKSNLHLLLTNVTYAGKTKYKNEVHEGEHDAIVDDKLFCRVQAMLQRNGRSGGSAVRNKHGALLKGLLRCSACDRAMTHTYTTKGNRRYRYYVCTKAQQSGWHECPSPSVPAGEIERFVVEQIKCIGQDPTVITETLTQVSKQAEEKIASLEREQSGLNRQLQCDDEELRRLATSQALKEDHLARIADIQERTHFNERRLTEISEELLTLKGHRIEEQDVAAALLDFSNVWDALAPRQQARILQLLIENIDYDGQDQNISITFLSNGIQSLIPELENIEEDAA